MVSQNANPNDIASWINIQNNEGFTALHYATFKGNLVIC